MLLSLMVYVVTVSLLLAMAAWALERAVRVFAFPTRWIWGGAMAGSVGYLLAAILRPRTISVPLETGAVTPLDALLIPVIGSITSFADTAPAGVSLDTILGAGWVVLTLLVAAVLARAYLRLRSDRSTWTLSELDGRDVLVSEDLGPGVVGWIRSVIVMPRWALGMPQQERELMLQHEGEHCNAGDSRVVGLALLLLMLLPWNLPLWWQLHRLRLAIEIDCDYRVLHRSADVERYARLLVEIGARGTAARLSALAFARPIPLIERRILAMTDSRDPRYMRIAGLTLLAALLLVASCQVEQLSITGEVEQTTPEAATDAIDQAERILPTRVDEVGVEEPPPTTPEVEPIAVTEEIVRPRADGEGVIQEARRTNTSQPPPHTNDDQAVDIGETTLMTPVTVRPELRNRNEIMQALMREYPSILRDAGVGGQVVDPVTLMTTRPELRNRDEVMQALIREYPAALRDSGVGGQVVAWFNISVEGKVLSSRISESSGHPQLDAAALKVADVYEFTPALNGQVPVEVWIQLPITFAAVQAAAQEISEEDRAAIQAGPVFTPMTVRPELRNRDEIMQALMREYPAILRDAGVSGQLAVWFYISVEGKVLDSRISQSSGHPQFDQVAVNVAWLYEFTPALNRGTPVPVWIQLPITFQVEG